MKIAIVYDFKTGNTRQAADWIAEGMNTVTGIEARTFSINNVDETFVLESKGVVIGSPSYAVLITPDLHAWLLTATEQLQMAGKLGGAFATEQYTHGGGNLVIQSILANMRMTRPLPPFHGSRSIPHLDNHKPYGKVFNIFFYIH